MIHKLEDNNKACNTGKRKFFEMDSLQLSTPSTPNIQIRNDEKNIIKDGCGKK